MSIFDELLMCWVPRIPFDQKVDIGFFEHDFVF